MNTYAKYCPNVFVAKCDEKHEKGEIITLSTRYGKENECEVWNFLYEKDGFFYYSITRADGFNCQERARAKAEKYEEWADNAQKRSDDAFERSQKAVAPIPFGQPILVGHHSERAHRAALRRSDNAMRKCVEESNKAENYSNKADYWEKMADKINLSMPENIEFYSVLLEKQKEYHEGLKSGKYPRRHSYSLTYAKKDVNETEKKLAIAKKLWGGEPNGTPCLACHITHFRGAIAIFPRGRRMVLRRITADFFKNRRFICLNVNVLTSFNCELWCIWANRPTDFARWA